MDIIKIANRIAALGSKSHDAAKMAASSDYGYAVELIEGTLPLAHGSEILVDDLEGFGSVLSVLKEFKKERTFGSELDESIDYIESALTNAKDLNRGWVLLKNPKENLETILKILNTPKKGLFV